MAAPVFFYGSDIATCRIQQEAFMFRSESARLWSVCHAAD